MTSCVFFARKSVLARESLLEIDTSLATATPGLRTNLLLQEPPFQKLPIRFSRGNTQEKQQNCSPKRENAEHARTISASEKVRNPEKGPFAKAALRRFVANCAPNSRKIAGISFRTSEEGCAKLSQTCRELESQFRTIWSF